MTRPNVVFDFHVIELAFEFVNCGDYSNSAYLDRHTGETLFFSLGGDFGEEPDDLDDSSRYVALPDKQDFGMGSRLAIQFVREFAPSLLEDVRDAFRGRGGFRRFKDLLDRNSLRDRWQQYEGEYERASIVQWCADNDIRYKIIEPTGG